MPLSARQSTETDYYYNEIPRKSYQWIYCDALNNIQGPFSDIKMQEWYEAGFFDDSLLVKREDALYFETLGALIQRIGNIKYAFLMDRPLNQISALSSPYHSLDTNDIYSSSDLNRTKLLTGNRSDGDPFERDQIKPHLYQSYHGNSFDQISNNRPSEVSSSIPPFIPSLSHPKASMDNYRYQPLKYGEADTFRGGYSMDPSFVNISQGQSYPFSATKSLYNEQPTLYPTMNDMGSISMDNYAYGLKQAMQQQYMNTHQQLLFQQKLLQQQLLLQHQQVCPVGIQPTPLAMHTKHDMRQGFFDGMQFNPPIAVTSPGIPHIPSPQIASSYGNISPVLEQSHDKVEIKSIDKEISEGMDRLVLTETARLEEKEYVEPNVENNKQGVKTITEQYFHLDESQEEQREVDNANLVLEITPNDSRVESPSVKIREDSGEDTNSSSSGNDTIELKAASDEFLKWCKLSLRGLNSGVNVDEIIQMLLSFPVDGSCSEIIQDMVYANSVSIDGRRFAHDFMTRRKADMEGKFDVRIPQSALLDDSFKVVTKKNKKRHPHPSS
ncbi:hypothetical protein BDB01DRAFT_815112 [Pilobolus umbonatus]|nr:hypothetical protein BDB01DRAFT_815112 [Pilobolus umbonatus]